VLSSPPSLSSSEKEEEDKLNPTPLPSS